MEFRVEGKQTLLKFELPTQPISKAGHSGKVSGRVFFKFWGQSSKIFILVFGQGAVYGSLCLEGKIAQRENNLSSAHNSYLRCHKRGKPSLYNWYRRRVSGIIYRLISQKSKINRSVLRTALVQIDGCCITKERLTVFWR